MLISARLSNSVEVAVPGVPNALIVHDLNFGKATRDLGTTLRERLDRWRGGAVERVIAVSEATRRRLVETGILLDLFVGVFVMGIVINHIRTAFEAARKAAATRAAKKTA